MSIPISSMTATFLVLEDVLREGDASRCVIPVWIKARDFLSLDSRSFLLFFVLQIMAHVVQSLDQPSNYKDSQSRVDRNRQNDLLAKSTTLYVCYPTTELRSYSILTPSLADR